jgi:hypothetical protein
MSVRTSSLVQNLFAGPIDVVGDIHGEIEALQNLLTRLGYGADGSHSEGRRLVFVGDLTDRGPDSPAVVRLVKQFVESGRAQCVLGNHDLNLLLCNLAEQHKGSEHPFGKTRKHDNHWFFGAQSSLDRSCEPTPAVLADDQIRQWVVDFLTSLPLVLERDNVRVVHACWDDAMVEMARRSSDTVTLYRQHHERIEADLRNQPELDLTDQKLLHQNSNPVKVLTSGKERRTGTRFVASGEVRYEERVKWWNDYKDRQLCVFGHYSNGREQTSTTSHAICIDFAVASRWEGRRQKSFSGIYTGSLAALRLPEGNVVTDDGAEKTLAMTLNT